MSWYRTYRPQTIAQLHLTDVRQRLQNMLKSGELPQVFLFTGPKGTGKTSSARILAKVFNCEKNAQHKAKTAYHEPCLKCEQCLAITQGSAMNVIEIDAASHRGIDNIRELREQVYYPPAQGEKLVYIIDEVHMLTKEAFNALLKILEEPPAHAVFILATTEFQKIIDTVVSRCTVVQFRSATSEEIIDSLEHIAQEEKLSVDEQVWPILTQHAQGSFRDAVKLFEQVVRQIPQDQTLTIEVVAPLLSSFSSTDAQQLIQDVLAKDEQRIAQFFAEISTRQFDTKYLHAQILSYLHNELLKALHVSSGDALASVTVLQFLLKHLSAVIIDERSPFPWLPLELCLLEMILKSKAKGSGSKSEHAAKSHSNITTPSVRTKASIQQSTEEPSSIPHSEQRISQQMQQPREADVVGQVSPVMHLSDDKPPELVDGKVLAEQWAGVLQMVRQQNFSLEALLRSSRFVKGELGKAVIEVFYKFHKEQLELDRNKRIVEECIVQHLGGLVHIEFVLATPAQKQSETKDDNVSGAVKEEELVKLAEEALL